MGLSSVASAGQRVRTGHAYDMQSGSHIYTEVHHEQWENNQLVLDRVEYRSPRGDVIATKEVDFSTHQLAPEYELVNHTTGHLEKVERKMDGVMVSFRKKDGNALKQKFVELPDLSVVDAGFDRFIESNWDELKQDGSRSLPFLIPGFQRTIQFEIALTGETAEHTLFTLSPDSGLLSFFVKPVELTYVSGSRALRTYAGISNMRDSAGRNYDVRVEFEQPGLAQRGKGDG